MSIFKNQTEMYLLLYFVLDRTLLSLHPNFMNYNNLAKPQEERWEELLFSSSGEQLHLSGKEAHFFFGKQCSNSTVEKRYWSDPGKKSDS